MAIEKLIETGELAAIEIVTVGVAGSLAIDIAINILILRRGGRGRGGCGHGVGGLGVRGRDCDRGAEGDGCQPIGSVMTDEFHKMQRPPEIEMLASERARYWKCTGVAIEVGAWKLRLCKGLGVRWGKVLRGL